MYSPWAVLFCFIVSFRLVFALPLGYDIGRLSRAVTPRGFSIPIQRNKRSNARRTLKRGDVTGEIGIGDNSDLYVLYCVEDLNIDRNMIRLYTVPIELGADATAVHLGQYVWLITYSLLTSRIQTPAPPTFGS